MDIVVTIPKSEYKNDNKENEDIAEKGYIAFWMLSKTPKNLKIGDVVYFVKNNKIDSSMKVIEIKTKEEDVLDVCETTGRAWVGKCQIFMDDLQKEDLNIEIKGFQGFRYKWW